MLLKVEQNTYSSSSDYNISTVQVNSYNTWTSPSYKIVRVVGSSRKQEVFSNKVFSQRKAHKKELSLGKKTWKTCEEKLDCNLRDSPP